VFERDDRLVFEQSTGQLHFPAPRLNGAHQFDNAGTAIAVAEVVFGGIRVDAVQRGLTQVKWPARLERLPAGALHDYVADGIEIWLDGGHNVAGAQAIARALAELDDPAGRKSHLIWGMMDSKDARAVISAFRDVVETVYTVPVPGETNSFSPDILAEIAASEGFIAAPTNSVAHALLSSQSAFKAPGRVLIFGSLYLAGHVLALHFNHQRSRAA
jgi:dihydrofolate synthase/folylpolyglutamate synthase